MKLKLYNLNHNVVKEYTYEVIPDVSPDIVIWRDTYYLYKEHKGMNTYTYVECDLVYRIEE